jgi:hypothetical protein
LTGGTAPGGTFTPTPDLSQYAIPSYALGGVPAGYTGPTTLPAGSATPVAPNGYQWATVLNNAGNGIAKILAISQGGSTVQLPNGAQIVYGSVPGSIAGAGSTAFSSSTGVAGLSIGTLGLLAVGAFVLMSMGKGR